MADEETTGGPAPDGVTGAADDTTSGPDETTAAAIEAPKSHAVYEVDVMAAEGAAADVPGAAADTPMHPVLASLAEQFESVVWSVPHGQDVATVDRETYLSFSQAAKAAGFEVCSDVTAVDWFRARRVRFDVVTNLVSQQHRCRLRIVVPVPGDEPSVSSVVPVWPGANFAEREVYDMFGIEFEGHPDLTRILMPDDWDGFPLRKDFGTGAVPVQFKGSHKVT